MTHDENHLITDAQLQQIVVIDFEGVPDRQGKLFPVEIGVSIPGQRTMARFITPAAAWQAGCTSWGNQAELLDRAMAEGMELTCIASWIARNLQDKIVLSDAAFVDRHMMERLLVTAGADCHVPVLEYFTFLDRLAHQRQISRDTINRWINEIDDGRGEAHRAGEDARIRAALLERIMERQPAAA